MPIRRLTWITHDLERKKALPKGIWNISNFHLVTILANIFLIKQNCVCAPFICNMSWRSQHLRGYHQIHVYYFCSRADVFICFSWFFENISRKEADKLLLAEENPRGTYLVRPSEHNPHGYSLSVKDWEEHRGYHVKHYKIKPLDNGGYYISTNKTFTSLIELVQAYSSK